MSINKRSLSFLPFLFLTILGCSTDEENGTNTSDFSGSVFVENQSPSNNTLRVKSTTMSRGGWLLLYRDNGNSAPNLEEMISVPLFLQKGYSHDLSVQLLTGTELSDEETLWAIIHSDTGKLKVFEYNGSNGLDTPMLTAGKKMVMIAFEIELPEEPGSPGEVGDLVWHDEFNQGQLDLTKWNYESGTGINGDWGTGQLDRATSRSENVSFENGIAGADGGCLVITTRKENYIDRNYTSGRINTSGKSSWGPGYRIVARVMPKGVRYQGQGFAFWMMPAEKPAGESHLMWPQGGEIDIMEYVGSIPYNNLGTVHYAWFWENNEYKDWNHGHLGAYYNYQDQQVPNPAEPGYGNFPPPSNAPYAGSASFHTYGIDWYHDRMEFFVDDNVYHIHYFKDGGAFTEDGEDDMSVRTIDGKRVGVSEYSNHFEEWHPFEHKMFMILSAGVGGSDYTYGGPIVPEAQFPAAVFIDWVRVYKLE
ncbi:glycoside hydrolase family 16 protein [Salinimicrobium soli]|uniref:glycoside hydrolase family 16 protein n=1 Tax=Salinimicrobium soli TaxID=1254399 RepID=UPI003AB0C4D9